MEPPRTQQGTRRDFVARAWRWAAGGLAVASAGALAAALGQVRGPVRRVRFEAAELARAGAAGVLRDGVRARREGEGVAALSLRCPHLGCTVEPAAGGFRCPCHRSAFDGEGRRLEGPAPTGLRTLQARAEGDSWVVTVEEAHGGTGD